MIERLASRRIEIATDSGQLSTASSAGGALAQIDFG
jgi:hypothetical protein